MIEYRDNDEREITLHYAAQINNDDILKIIKSGQVKNSSEAILLRDFFWQMVDLSVQDEQDGKEVCGYLKRESCLEGIMQSFRSYLISSGYEEEWNDDE